MALEPDRTFSRVFFVFAAADIMVVVIVVEVDNIVDVVDSVVVVVEIVGLAPRRPLADI